jgi:hypothetical protein
MKYLKPNGNMINFLKSWTSLVVSSNVERKLNNKDFLEKVRDQYIHKEKKKPCFMVGISIHLSPMQMVPSMLQFIVISCEDLDWPITEKINRALKGPKTDL